MWSFTAKRTDQTSMPKKFTIALAKQWEIQIGELVHANGSCKTVLAKLFTTKDQNSNGIESCGPKVNLALYPIIL